jgi:hypothetical protein
MPILASLRARILAVALAPCLAFAGAAGLAERRRSTIRPSLKEPVIGLPPSPARSAQSSGVVDGMPILASLRARILAVALAPCLAFAGAAGLAVSDQQVLKNPL